MFHTPVGDREGERKRDPDGDEERERGREIRHQRTLAGDRERERKREPTRIRGIPARSLSLFGQRDAESGFQSNSAGNPDDLARSGQKCRDRKPMHIGVGLTDLVLHLRRSLLSSRSRRSIEIPSS
jgi:hypothetical protein